MDFLLKVLRSDDPLVKDVDYQMVKETIDQMVPQDKCGRIFSRTDEEYRPTYEMIKQNKMPESESMFAKFLNNLFGEGKKGARQQKIDGSKMPDYEMVRHYLNPAGMQITSEKDGWFLKGFTLNMEAVKGEQTVQSSQSQTPAEPQTKPDSQNSSRSKNARRSKNAGWSSRHPRIRQRRRKARLNWNRKCKPNCNRSKRKTARLKNREPNCASVLILPARPGGAVQA